MKKIVGCSVIMIVSLWMTAFPTGAANVEKTALLQQKISDIQALQEKIGDIKIRAVALHGVLQGKAEKYTAEINKEKTVRKLKSFNQAIGVYRIRYNLKLVQQIRAYLAAVSGRIEFFQAGRERIDFLHEQARDDLKMVQTLSDMEIADLIHRIDRALEKYETAAAGSLFDIEKIQQEKLETLWKTISALK